jgi:hypothetical protein
MHCPVLWMNISAFAEQVWSRPLSSSRVQLHILISYPEYRSCNELLLIQNAAMLPLLYQVPKHSCCSASWLRSRSGISRWNPSPQSSVMAPVRIYRGLPCCWYAIGAGVPDFHLT